MPEYMKPLYKNQTPTGIREDLVVRKAPYSLGKTPGAGQFEILEASQSQALEHGTTAPLPGGELNNDIYYKNLV